MIIRASVLSLFLSVFAIAAPPVRSIPLKLEGDIVTVVRSFPCLVTTTPDASVYIWTVPNGVKYNKSQNILTITSAPAGTYKISVQALFVDFDKKKVIPDEGEITIVVGGPEPTPGPGPTPDPAPIPAGDLRVLIVFESQELPTMDAAQRSLLFDSKLRGILKDRTDKKGPNGRGCNIFDKDQDVSKMDKFWQDAMKRPRAKTPFVHMYKGNTVVYEGEFPKTLEEMTNLINKYSGN